MDLRTELVTRLAALDWRAVADHVARLVPGGTPGAETCVRLLLSAALDPATPPELRDVVARALVGTDFVALVERGPRGGKLETWASFAAALRSWSPWAALGRSPRAPAAARRAVNGHDRDPSGRFAPGNRGGPGRLPRRVDEAYLDELRRIVSMAKWRKVVKQALEDALAGNGRARSWLAKYLLPSPAGLEAIALREPDIDDEVSRLSPREVAERILALPIMYQEKDTGA